MPCHTSSKRPCVAYFLRLFTETSKLPAALQHTERIKKIVAAPDDLNSIFADAIRAYDTLVEEIMAERPPAGPYACRQGCNTCCSQPELSLSAVEVLCVAEHIEKTFTAGQRAALREQLADLKTAKRSTAGVNPQPLYDCPLMTTSGCSVYEARPFACRGHHSYDLAECEEAKRTGFTVPVIHQYGEQVAAAQIIVVALRQGLLENNLEADLLDLHLALKIALDDPDARTRWLAGETIFADARARNAES